MELNFRTGELSTLARCWSLSNHAEAKAGGDASHPEEMLPTQERGNKVRSHPEDGPRPGSRVVADHPQMQQLKEFLDGNCLGNSLSFQPVVPIPLIPELHHCGLSLL